MTATPKQQATADKEYDRLREQGHASTEQKRIVEEMEEKHLYPDGR